MGGFGSGRYDQVRSTGSVEQATRIDLRAIRRGLAHKHASRLTLDSSERFELSANIIVGVLEIASLEGSELHLIASLQIVEHSRHYGGYQSYLVCPECEMRYQTLYMNNEKEIACRKCLNLCYDSQYQSPPIRHQVKANKLRKQLGGKPGLINPLPDKPRYMHWKSYWEKVEKIRELEQKHIQAMEKYKAASLAEIDRLVERYDEG